MNFLERIRNLQKATSQNKNWQISIKYFSGEKLTIKPDRIHLAFLPKIFAAFVVNGNVAWAM